MVPLSGLSELTALSGFLWFLRCCFPTAGALSKPQNLRVEILDFNATVLWESGLGNPSNSTYVLEQQEFGGSWTKIEKCTSVLTCHLDDFGSFDDLLKEYFVRVKAIWKDESSDWTNASSFQPYRLSLFTPPLLKVGVQGQSIFVDIHHPSKKKVEGLVFAIDLLRNFSGQEDKVAQKISADGFHFFHKLPVDRYCVNVSVVNYLKKQFAVECVVLHGKADGWPWVIVATGVSFLLAIPVGLILIIVLCYLWPRSNYLRTPETLIIRVMKPKVLDIVSEKTSAMMVCVLKYEENNRSVDYEVRRGFTSVRDMSLVCSKGAICLAPEEDDDVCTGGIHHSADYGLELDSSDEDTPVTETPLYAAACLYETHECFENGLSREMARLMVDVQLQDNVSLNSLNSQSTRSSESIESTEDATETPLDRSFNYEPRHLIAWYNRDEVSQ